MNDKQAAGQPQAAQEFKPGDTITPSSAAPAPAPAEQPQLPAVEAPQPVEAPTQPPTAPIAQPEPLPVPEQPLPPSQMASEEPLIQWRATEFLAHDKTPVWYLALFGDSVVIAALVYLLTKDKLSTVVVLIAAIALSVYAGRKPREVDYALYADGLAIGQKVYLYAQFRTFSMGDEGPIASIALVPHKRFGQLVTLYFHPEDEPLIVDFISSHLPLERRSQDPIDLLMKKIRF